MKNKKIIDRQNALEKSFHLGAISLFQLKPFRNGREKRAVGSGFDFAEKEAKVIIFHLMFLLITLKWYNLSNKKVNGQPVMACIFCLASRLYTETKE